MLKDTNYRAMKVHENYINEINNLIEKKFFSNFTEIIHHLKLIPNVVERARGINEFYDITSDENKDVIRIRPFKEDDIDKYFKGHNVNLKNYYGFVVKDNAYRKTAVYAILFNREDYIILSYEPLLEKNPILIGNEMLLLKNEIIDLEGLLWLLCAVLDVFFSFESEQLFN